MAPSIPIGMKEGSIVLRGWQALLLSIGHDPGPLDGLWGSRTRVATEDFQRAAKLPITGVPTLETVSAALLFRELQTLGGAQ